MSFIAINAYDICEDINCFGRGETPEEAFDNLDIEESNELWERDDDAIEEATRIGYVEIRIYKERPINLQKTLDTGVVEKLLQEIGESMYDLVGDISENYLVVNKITPEAKEELRTSLVSIVDYWMSKHKLHHDFFSLGALVETKKVPYPLQKMKKIK